VRVCFITHYYPPETGAPQTRIELLARTLADAGAMVTVHTCFPHYPEGRISAPYRNRPWQVEHRGKVRVVRSAVYPAANRGFGRRLADHASFALSALATARLSGPVDVVVGESPPLFTGAAGAAYARLKRAAYVVNIADRWPASAIELGMLRDPRAIAAASTLEREMYRRCDLIVAPTEGIVSALQLTPEASGKARRAWPVVDVDRFDPSPPASTGGPLELLYAGTVGLAQGLDVLIEATRLAGPQIVRTTVAGAGAAAQELRQRIARDAVANVRMLGPVSAETVTRLYAGADAAVVMLRDLPIFSGALPTKTLEAMAAGRPAIVAARGEAADLVTRAGAGLVVEPGNPRALAQACRRLAGEPELRLALGRAGRAYAEEHFGAGAALEAWTRLLDEALSARCAGAPRSSPTAGGQYRAG
jgi:colanic acid biosynthesis glycosyl transferase WcaI